jgi:hypothetical protein
MAVKYSKGSTLPTSSSLKVGPDPGCEAQLVPAGQVDQPQNSIAFLSVGLDEFQNLVVHDIAQERGDLVFEGMVLGILSKLLSKF